MSAKLEEIVSFVRSMIKGERNLLNFKGVACELNTTYRSVNRALKALTVAEMQQYKDLLCNSFYGVDVKQIASDLRIITRGETIARTREELADHYHTTVGAIDLALKQLKTTERRKYRSLIAKRNSQNKTNENCRSGELRSFLRKCLTDESPIPRPKDLCEKFDLEVGALFAAVDRLDPTEIARLESIGWLKRRPKGRDDMNRAKKALLGYHQRNELPPSMKVVARNLDVHEVTVMHAVSRLRKDGQVPDAFYRDRAPKNLVHLRTGPSG